MIPKTYDEWKKCIVKDCKIDLTMEFAEKRIFELKNSENNQISILSKNLGEWKGGI